MTARRLAAVALVPAALVASFAIGSADAARVTSPNPNVAPACQHPNPRVVCFTFRGQVFARDVRPAR